MKDFQLHGTVTGRLRATSPPEPWPLSQRPQAARKIAALTDAPDLSPIERRVLAAYPTLIRRPYGAR